MGSQRTGQKQHFDLEVAIANWRHQFKYDRAFSATDLDELERHLRDEVADLVDSGEGPKHAFELALSEMGGVLRAETEYGKVRWQKVVHERRVIDEVAIWLAMVSNYLKLGYRNLRRDKAPSVINIVGMSIALSVAIVVYLFVIAWNTMDAFHENGDRLFYAQHVIESDFGPETWGRMPLPLAPVVESEIPQVERAVRLNWQGASVTVDDQVFDETVAFVDDGFLDILTFPMQFGSKDALSNPATVILSDKMSRKLFGDSNPVGRSLTLIFDRKQEKEVTVGAVARQFPSNTGLRFGILMRFDVQRELGLVDLDDWSALTSGMIVLVRDAADVAGITQQMDRYVSRINAVNPDRSIEGFTFDNLADPSPEAHLVRGRISEAAHPAVTIMFVTIALFMLALSCFNYINVTIGSAARRFNEIGMRKAVGGSRRQLIQQFITENVLMCTFSLALAVVIAKVFLVPILNSIFILQIELDLLSNPLLWVFLAALLITVAFVSGAYPAFYVSSFETVSIFRGRRLLGQNDWLTRAFLTFQFVLAFVTVILGVVLTMNSRYLIQQDWGYDPANKIVVELTEARQFGPLRDRLVRHPHVISVVGASDHVGRGLNTIEVQDPDGESTRVASYKVGPGYIETLGLNLTRGRLLEADRPSDLTDAVVVNQKFVQSHGWSEPLGQIVRVDDHRYSVVGVVEDFSFFFLAEPMPTILTAASAENFGYLIIGVDGSIDEVKNQVASVWTELYPNSVLREFSQADVFDDTYTQYNRITRVFSYLAGLALLIACMGLFGLASQSLARRVKEFGIRKVVGATVSQLAILANRSFLIMLVLSATVATAICVIGLNVVLSVVRDIVPIAHMPITPLPFSIAYGLVFSAAAIAVGVHLLKLRRTNPAEVLRVP